MITTVTARDSDLPVALDEAKDHLRVINGDYDALIMSLLEAATEFCEAATSRALRISHTLTQSYGAWPCGRVLFDRQPVSAITHVKYYDTTPTLQTLSSAYYRLHQSSEAAAYLEFDDSFTAPALDDRDDAVIVTYTAGYGTIAAVPKRAKQAILLLVGHWFAHGEAVNIGNITTEVPMGTAALLQSLDAGSYR